MHVLLRVELQAGVVHPAIEVDRELRHARDRPVHVDEVRRAVAGQDPSGDAEVAVEPRVEEHTAVDLDAELTPTRRIGVGVGLDAQAGRVGVGADQTERGVGTVAGREDPGDQRAVAGDDAACRHTVPRVALRDRGEARRLEAAAGGLDGVER